MRTERTAKRTAALTPVKAIRRKCLLCSHNSYRAVRECIDEICPLRPYRLGKNPRRAKVGGGPRNPKLPTQVPSFEQEGAIASNRTKK